MVRIESGGSSFLRRVSAKIKLCMPGMMAIIASISPQPPLSKLVRVGILLKKAFKPSPTTNPAPQVFPQSKREVPLFPEVALLARERGARSSRERPTGHTLDSLTCWWSGPMAPTRLQPATSRPPTSCRLDKEPFGSFTFLVGILSGLSFFNSISPLVRSRT